MKALPYQQQVSLMNVNRVQVGIPVTKGISMMREDLRKQAAPCITVPSHTLPKQVLTCRPEGVPQFPKEDSYQANSPSYDENQDGASSGDSFACVRPISWVRLQPQYGQRDPSTPRIE